MPQQLLLASSARELAGLVNTVQEAVKQVAEIFDSRFSDLVTNGQAAEYPALVERFKPKFAACSDSLARIADALASHSGLLARLVGKVRHEEDRRFELQLELQVLRQRCSLLGLDDPDLPELKTNTDVCQKALDTCTLGIYEVLEELRCEAAEEE